MRRLTKQKRVTDASAGPALAFLRDHCEKAKQEGLPPLAPPPGYFLDIPPITREASDFATRVRNSLAGKDVEYSVHKAGDQLIIEASYAL